MSRGVVLESLGIEPTSVGSMLGSPWRVLRCGEPPDQGGRARVGYATILDFTTDKMKSEVEQWMTIFRRRTGVYGRRAYRCPNGVTRKIRLSAELTRSPCP